MRKEINTRQELSEHLATLIIEARDGVARIQKGLAELDRTETPELKNVIKVCLEVVYLVLILQTLIDAAHYFYGATFSTSTPIKPTKLLTYGRN